MKATLYFATMAMILAPSLSPAQQLKYTQSLDGTVRDAEGNVISKPGTLAEAEAAARQSVQDLYGKTGKEAASCVFQNHGDKYQNTPPVEGDPRGVSVSCPDGSVSDAHAGNHQTGSGTVGISDMDKESADKTGRAVTAVNTGDKGGYATYDPKTGTLTVVGAKDQSLQGYIDDCDRKGWERSADGHGLACIEGTLRLCADAAAEAAGLCDEYQIMRDKDHEGEAKKKAERLRRQQPEEEPNVETKKNDVKKTGEKKKEAKKKDEKKKSETRNKEDSTTPKPTPKPTATVDFSKMKQSGSGMISILNAILSSGRKATGSQISQFNSLKQSYAAEVNQLKTQIEAMGNAEQRSRYYGQLVSINNQIDSKVVSLQRSAASAGLLTLH